MIFVCPRERISPKNEKGPENTVFLNECELRPVRILLKEERLKKENAWPFSFELCCLNSIV